jgi:hypothetical protein
MMFEPTSRLELLPPAAGRQTHLRLADAERRQSTQIQGRMPLLVQEEVATDTMDPTEVRQLLDELCVDLGFCLPPSAKSQLEQEPPDQAEAFARAVFIAEGLNPDSADLHLFRQVRSRISDAMHRSTERQELSRRYQVK